MEHLPERSSSCLDMQRSDNSNLHQSNGMPPSAEQVEEVLRFARKLEMHRDHGQLLRALPAELCVLVDCAMTALIHLHEGRLTTHVVDSQGCALSTDHSAANWPEAVWQAISEQQKPLVLPALDQPSLDENQRFPEAVRFFRECGNQSLCLLPLSTALHRLGALCIGRKHPDAFSEKEVSLLLLVSDYAALAIDYRFNFAQSQQIRAELETESTKLRLILNLNNSVVSNLELRDVLQSVSPGIRQTLRVDGVALTLPDREGQELQLCALDFPDGDSAVRQNWPASLYGSAAGQVFRSGKPWIGDIGQLQRAGLDYRIASAAGVETLRMLPLIRGNRVLGVLCLVRTEKNAFNQL
jgi:formate hydrogenlyase transcriptional activator